MRPTRLAALSLLAAGALALAGCSSDSSANDGGQTDSSSGQSSTTSSQQKAETLTEGSSVTYTASDTIDDSDTPTIELTLDKLSQHDHGYDGDPDNEFTDKIKPSNGQYVAMNITVKNVGDSTGTFLPQPYFVADDGKKTEGIESPATLKGVESDESDIANQNLDAGEYAEGVWVFDVPDTSGKVVIPESGQPAVEIPIDPLN